MRFNNLIITHMNSPVNKKRPNRLKLLQEKRFISHPKVVPKKRSPQNVESDRQNDHYISPKPTKTMIARIAISITLLACAASPLAFPSKSLSKGDRLSAAQESCVAAARKSGAIVSAPQGVDAVCGTSLMLNPMSQPVLEATQDGSDLPIVTDY
jgi:hypothetical protein